ncbi:MAG: triose-phosphate isomerase [Holosporales bacterium]
MNTRPLIAGNWKMHGLLTETSGIIKTLEQALAEAPLPGVDIAVFPPFTALSEVSSLLRKSSIAHGGQDCHAEPKGAFTGDISAGMLAELGCQYVLVGHSERRQYHGEDDALLKRKVEAAQRSNLVPILCVGETLAERDAGETLAVVRRQVTAAQPKSGAYVIAYEPVWAIGTGRVATPEQVAEVHAAIAALAPGVRILYGGSVKPDNAASLLSLPHVHGALVGGASLDAKSFYAIAAAATLR